MATYYDEFERPDDAPPLGPGWDLETYWRGPTMSEVVAAREAAIRAVCDEAARLGLTTAPRTAG